MRSRPVSSPLQKQFLARAELFRQPVGLMPHCRRNKTIKKVLVIPLEIMLTSSNVPIWPQQSKSNKEKWQWYWIQDVSQRNKLTKHERHRKERNRKNKIAHSMPSTTLSCTLPFPIKGGLNQKLSGPSLPPRSSIPASLGDGSRYAHCIMPTAD